MMYQLLLAIVLLIWVRSQEGSVVITRPPQNQTACEGDNVTITCGFDGIDIRSNWIIDNITHGHNAIVANNMLYAPNVNNTNDTVLIMFSVTASMNGTRTQCELQILDPIYSSIAVLTIMGTPLTPNVVVAEVALESFRASWDAFSHDACGGVAYNIRLFKGLQLIVENITTVDNISFTGLNDTTLYRVSVFATNNAGPGTTVSINVTTLTPAVLSPPRQLKVNTLFIDYEPIVWITWTSPLLTLNMTEVEAYNVTLYDKDQLLSFTILQSQTVFNLSEEDIKLNIRDTYTITVSAINSVGYSPVAMTTFSVPNLQLMGIFNSSTNEINIIVTWDAANSSYCGGVLYYIVMISSDEHSNIMNDTVNVTDLTVTFYNLRNDTNYDVTVTAYNRVGAGMNTTVTESIRISPPVTTQPPSTCVSKSDDELSTGAAVAISNVVTFIITLVVTALITYIITSLYYKHMFKKSLIRQEGDSYALTEDIKSNDPAAYATTRANITMDTNPAYGTATTIKMDTNPAYATTT